MPEKDHPVLSDRWAGACLLLSANSARRVCMFVYNNLLHDARVRKEARTLTQAGYDVTVLAVHDPGRTQRQEEVDGFHVIRLSRSLLGVSRREMGAALRRQPVTPMPARASSPTSSPTSRGPKARLLAALELLIRRLLYPLRRVLVFQRFVRAALRVRADVHHAHDLNTLLMAYTASRLRHTPLIYDTHEVETGRAKQRLRWWAAFLERALIRRADRVICTNQTRADYTQQRYRLSPPTILRNLPAYVEPPPSTLLHERLHLPRDTKVVLYQGGVQPERGLEQLVEAARDIEGGVVVILGSGRLKPALQQLVHQRRLAEKVVFHDAVPVGELPQWTACAYLGLQILQNTCFNHYSSLSNKLLEYLMAGVPVIASDLPEMRRVLEDTGAGLIIDTSDPHQLAAACNQLLADPTRREEMSLRAKAARSGYSWEREEQVLVELYAGLFSR